MAEVRDLDALRPESHVVKLGGKEIDVSFLPTGLTFDIDAIVQEMSKLNTDKITKNEPGELHKAFDLSVKLCATFCGWQHPEMTEKWFRANTNVAQLNILGEEIRGALDRAYTGIDPKN